MNKIISNPGLDHISQKIAQEVDYPSLRSLSRVCKDFDFIQTDKTVWLSQVEQLAKLECFNEICGQFDLTSELVVIKHFVHTSQRCLKFNVENENLKDLELQDILNILLNMDGQTTQGNIRFFLDLYQKVNNQKPFCLAWIYENHDNMDFLHIQLDLKSELPRMKRFVQTIQKCLQFNEENEKLNRLELHNILDILVTLNDHSDIKFLLELYSKANYQKAFWWACIYEQVDLLKTFDYQRIDINLNNTYGYPPLFCASIDGYIEVVKFLLSLEGIEVTLNIINMARENGQNQIVDLLVQSWMKNKHPSASVGSGFTIWIKRFKTLNKMTNFPVQEAQCKE